MVPELIKSARRSDRILGSFLMRCIHIKSILFRFRLRHIKAKIAHVYTFDIKQLAVSAHMSTSAFHKAFKDITADSPLQYLKKIRLAKARDLIVQRKMRANLAASEVGYESPSQFSREFKRYFGESPADVMREMRSS